MRSITVIIAVCLLLFLAGCACPAAKPAPAPGPVPGPEPAPTPGPAPAPPPGSEEALQLARKFCPVINLNGEPDDEENFQPDAVQLMVDLSLLRDLADPAFTEKPTIPDLLRWFRSDYYLDIANLDPKSHTIAEYKDAYEAIEGNYMPTLYARVTQDEDYTILQYWLFYYLNDWRNVHEGDWEMVQLHFPRLTPAELLKSGEMPVFAAYSQHQTGQRMAWGSMEEQGFVSGTHPVVYVARGSHANYFAPGQFWSGLDFDDTGLSSWRTISPEQFDVVLLTEAEDGGVEWLDFQGYWGEYIGFSISVMGLKFGQRGPFGPEWGEAGSKSKKWQRPAEWAAGLSEYPKPFWTSFLSIPGDWFKLAVFSLFSPADVHVYDSLGRHVGLDEQGNLEIAIPGAIYVTPEGTDYKTILIPGADVTDEYTVFVQGTDSGTMDLKAQVPDTQNRVRRFLQYVDVPITPRTAARASIKPELPRMMMPEVAVARPANVRDEITVLEIDSDGDGAFEIESRPGSFETQKVVRDVLKAEIDISPDTLSLSPAAVEKSLTAYIKLPAGISPENVDISSVRLFGKIPALEGMTDIVDYDQDGILELAVKFDRQLVLDYLASTGKAGEEIVFTVSGIVNGELFNAVDTVDLLGAGLEPDNR